VGFDDYGDGGRFILDGDWRSHERRQ
jgi:hypothetical protein